MTKEIENRVNTMLEIMCLPDGTPVVPVDAIDRLAEMGFFTAPASTKYHGAYEGGLFDHSYNVTYALLELTKQYRIYIQSERFVAFWSQREAVMRNLYPAFRFWSYRLSLIHYRKKKSIILRY